MITDNFREDEIQVLIALIELREPVETPNNNFYKFYPKDMDAARLYFRCFALDFSEAYESLVQKGLLCLERDLCLLSPFGLETARLVRSSRPPIWYWYKEFYAAIEHSKTYAEYCKRVFGQDLGQHGFSDMRQIEQMLALLQPGLGYRLLDIGCGNGRIAEYISDRSGAQVTGIDTVPDVIEQAKYRTMRKKRRLQFCVCSIDELDRLDEMFDGIISIDSVFFGESLGVTLGSMKNRLSPGGSMAIFCEDDLAPVLKQNDLSHQCLDLSQSHYEHLQLKHRVAKELKREFEAEGNRFIWENLMTESAADPLPYDPDRHAVRRSLYHVWCI